MSLSYQSGKITVSFRDILKNVLDLTELTDDLNKTWTQSFASGTGADQAQIHWHDQITLNSGASLTLDLDTTAQGGDQYCNNGFGDCKFTKVKAVLVKLSTATAGYKLEVGGALNPVPLFKDTSDIAIVQAEGFLLLTAPVDGVAVTAGTGDLLKLNNPSAGAVTFDIVLIGTGTVV